MPVRRIWIDCDPALGMLGRDADDALALRQAWGTPGVEVGGISASYGNARLRDTLRIAREVAGREARHRGRQDIQAVGGIVPGAEGAGRACGDGVEACVRALEAGPLVYLALAPLTHLAAVLAARPDLAKQIQDVVFVGGRTPGTRFFFGWCLYEFHDANVDKDPEAVRRVLEAPVPLTLVPIERAQEALLPQAGFREAVGGDAGGRWLEERTRNWFRLWRWCTGLKGAPVFDSLAMLAALEPEWVEFEERAARLEPFRGHPALHAVRGAGGRRVRFVSNMRAGAVEQMLVRMEREGDSGFKI